MEKMLKIRENWLTRAPHPSALGGTFLISAAVALLGLWSLDDTSHFAAATRATPAAVFSGGEYWRAFASLFVHGDLGHLGSNLFLFIPLTYLILAFFGPGLLSLGFAAGTAVNLVVLKTLPAHTALIGISGVVYWMGAAWLTLFLLIDRRERLKRRFGSALFLILLLFVPETLRAEVSHLSHLLGFVAGAGLALGYYAVNKSKFSAAEVMEAVVYADEFEWEEKERAPDPEICAACEG
ncbi:MAG: rhomboid family intramembrane serine protease [Proteobacteria bacterium]|nr:MAG: rhomboid family intramembrane serine protease [Pseudomonadota bacterium]